MFDAVSAGHLDKTCNKMKVLFRCWWLKNILLHLKGRLEQAPKPGVHRGDCGSIPLMSAREEDDQTNTGKLRHPSPRRNLPRTNYHPPPGQPKTNLHQPTKATNIEPTCPTPQKKARKRSLPTIQHFPPNYPTQLLSQASTPPKT